ncbi:MAG: TolC family outer membrane protein [Aquincola sp.]|nr:TolC family outer membrane protein [Aquincola sp.]
MPNPLPRRRPGHLMLAVLLALGAAPAARAQSLIELYNAARPYDATYLAARALADSNQFRAAQADALRLPSIGVGASHTNARTDWRTRDLELKSRTTVVGISGRQTLFNRADSATIAQAQVLLEASAAELETAEQDLVVRVAQAYFDVLAAQDTLGTAQANKKAISEQLASAKRNFEVGTATITDTREAQARFDLATSQELAAENDLRTRRVVLDQLVGRANVQPNPLKQPVMLPDLAPADAEAWVTSAWDTHPGVRRALAGLETARLETEKARAGHLPTVELTAQVGGQRQRGNAAELPGNSVPASVGVEMNLPLFAGFAIQNRVKETLALEERARNDLDAARRSVATATRTAYFQVQSGLAQARALEAAEASSRLALEATQLGYRVGVRVNLDVLNAQTQLFTTQRDLAFARYNVLLGTLRLKQAAGQLRGDDLLAINALLTP